MPPPPLEESSMPKRYTVVLSEPERARLHTLIAQGAGPARALTHARILLKANQGEAGPSWTDQVIADALEVHLATVARVRQHYATAGLDAALDARHPSANTAGGAGDRGVGVVRDGPPGLEATASSRG
jgi:hypothetical protein